MHINERIIPSTQRVEGDFRLQVRNLLDLHPTTRDDQIFDELRRLKMLEEKVSER